MAPRARVWARTGTKDPAYSDVLYVEELIGPDTVNTMPPATMDAFRDHGHPRSSLTEDLDKCWSRAAGHAPTAAVVSAGVMDVQARCRKGNVDVLHGESDKDHQCRR